MWNVYAPGAKGKPVDRWVNYALEFKVARASPTADIPIRLLFYSSRNDSLSHSCNAGGIESSGPHTDTTPSRGDDAGYEHSSGSDASDEEENQKQEADGEEEVRGEEEKKTLTPV